MLKPTFGIDSGRYFMNSLEFAIQIETDGSKYYSEQAQANKGTSLSKIFLILAEQEKKHLEILWNIAEMDFSKLPDNNNLIKTRSIFEGMENFKDEIRDNPSQVEIYEVGLEMEQKSVDLYKKLKGEADNDKDKAILQYFVDQETVHFEILDELVTRIRRPDEWVESAEFGVREDY